MSNPKYLPIPKKVPYNIRLPKQLLESLNAYAELTDNTTTDIVIGALNDFIKDKTVYNDYLTDIKGISIRLPMIHNEKTDFYNVNLIGENSADELYNEVYGYNATSEPYEILKIPNNLDIFDKTFGYVTPVEEIIGKGRHSGIEIAILPEYYRYYDNSDDVFGALYCLYFEVERDKLKSIKLIDYMDAINKANDVGNVTLKNNIISCVTELKRVANDIENGEYNSGGVDDDINEVVELLKIIGEIFNTGNITPLGENIDAAVVTAKVNENPELYDEFMDDIKDKTERYVDDVIADRVHNILDYRLEKMEKLVMDGKSKDEITTAIGNAKIKTKK